MKQQFSFPTFKKILTQDRSGFILLLTIVTALALFIALAGILNLSTINYSTDKRTVNDLSAQYVAEAGADKAVFQINEDNSYTGTNTVCPIGTTGENPVTLFNDSTQGKGTYESCITAGSIANEKIIYAVGKIYYPATKSTPISTRKIKVVIEGTQNTSYTVQSGPAGLLMSNSATITTGPIYVGGFLNMSNTATIGSAGKPVAVNVANARCPSPADSTYPQICGSGVQPNPITISNQAHIYGNVTANGQTNGASMSNGGLVGNSGVSPPSLPDYARDSQKAAVTSTMTAAAASCSHSGTVTWPANVHITGSVTTTQSCTILVSGNAWLDGSFTMSNSSTIKPAASVSVTPTIMVDGSGGVSLNNQSVVATNGNNIGLYFITFYSKAACSPNCGNVTGTDLFNSQGVQTISIGNQGLAAGSTFYARWTALALSNGGSIGAIMGQEIILNNSGNITLGTNAAGGGTYTYDVRYYELQ